MRLILLTCIVGLLYAGGSYADEPMPFKAKLEGFDLAGNPVSTTAPGHGSGDDQRAPGAGLYFYRGPAAFTEA